MLSRLTTDARESPSRFPTGTSCGMPLMVEVTSATTTLLRYVYAGVRVKRRTGRRPIGSGRFPHKMSYCLTGVFGSGGVLDAVPTHPDSGKHLRSSRAAAGMPPRSPVLQSPTALVESRCG